MENRTGIRSTKIRCERVSKSFHRGSGSTQVLKDIDFEVKENEFIVVLGPARSGKTTLLRILAGLEAPSAGRVLVDSQEVSGPGPDRGFVFQKYALLPWKTVMDNVDLGPKLRGVGKKKRQEIARRYISLVGLDGFERAYPHQLSGGMKQRVSIARAYANDPQVMLFDEPFGQLDAQTRYNMQQELVRIWDQEKRTIVFVTNNVEEAIYLGDRIISLQGSQPGRIKTMYQVDMPRPRRHTEAAFLDLRHHIVEETELVL